MLANTVPTPKPMPPVPVSDVPQGQSLTVESRFGTLVVAPAAMLTVPQGLLGFGDYREFGLAELPNGKYPQFRVLQCLTDQNLAFLVAPVAQDANAIDHADIVEACAVLGMAIEDLAVMLIVTVRRDDDGAHVSVNLRAPLFVDTRNRIARQYVLPNGKYPVRQPL